MKTHSKSSTPEATNAPANQPDDDRKFWDGNWASAVETGIEPPDAPTWFNERDGMLLDFIRPYLPPGGTVAELGCGSARLLARNQQSDQNIHPLAARSRPACPRESRLGRVGPRQI